MAHKPLIGIGSDVLHQEGERDRAFVFTTYVEALRRAGAVPLLIPPQPENAAELIEQLDGILLAGGEDCDPSLYGEARHDKVEELMHPARQANDVALAKAARERGIPTLGICLGVQVMNVAAGGTLVQHIESDIDHASEPTDRHRHEVTLRDATKLASIIGQRELNVNSSHHQAVKDVGRGLRVTADAPDGVVEGLEDPRHPFYVGVQWHPEDMPGERSATALFGALIAAARRYADEKRRKHTDLSPVGAAESE